MILMASSISLAFVTEYYSFVVIYFIVGTCTVSSLVTAYVIGKTLSYKLMGILILDILSEGDMKSALCLEMCSNVKLTDKTSSMPNMCDYRKFRQGVNMFNVFISLFFYSSFTQ